MERNGDGETKTIEIESILAAINDIKLGMANVSIVGNNSTKSEKIHDNKKSN